MDNPGISLFQGADININNSQNNEEEEDLEDQIRRKEELQNLLQANLDDFRYDDSTINSSTNISVASVENLDQNYKNAITPNEQLRVLYDVRCREIHALKEEYDKFKVEKTKLIDSLKHQNVIFEAELRQLKISMNSVESLLVEKTESNNQLNSALQNRDAKIENLEKNIKDYEMDISTYKSEITELQLKLQSQNGPFNLNAKYNSEEFQKSLQDKIIKLENTFEEQTKKLETCIEDKQVLQEEIQLLVVEKTDLEKESSAILRNFNDAQQQCKDLIDVVEMLKKENDHFKERLHQIEENRGDTIDYNKQKLVDNVTLASHNEKLKKMLLDKSIEVDTLNTKLRYYESDLKQLVEYRQLKSDVYKKEFKTCDNPSHTKDLLLMQNDLQNYRRIIDDKNQQMLNLNSNNKDLKEKIEEMLLQTRNEIQNFSFKYNVPKLEIMSKELEKAENTVKVLSEKLEESEERRLSLLKKLQSKNEQNDTAALIEELGKCTSELKETKTLLRNEQDQNTEIFKELEYYKNEVLRLKNLAEELKIERRKSKSDKKSPSKSEKQTEDTSIKNEYELLKQQLLQVMEHLEKNSSNSSSKKEHPEIVSEIKSQMDEFLASVVEGNVEKGILEDKINSWKKLLDQMEIREPDEILKSQYQEAIINLRSSNEKVKELEDLIQDLKNSLTISEGEKCSLSVELKEYVKKLDSAEKLMKHMKVLGKEKKGLKEREMIGQGDGLDKDESCIDAEKLNNLRDQLNSKEIDLKSKEENLRRIEQEKEEMKEWLEKMSTELARLKSENSKLGSELKEIEEKCQILRNQERADRNGIENKNSIQNINVVESQEFKSRLEEELMKAELKLRDDVQLEYQKRIRDIEKRYQKSCKETNELCKQQKEELEEQDKKFREYLKMVLSECESCTSKLENEKLELVGQLKLLKDDFDKYKSSIVANEGKYCKVLKKMERESEKNIEAWKMWSKKVVSSCLDIEATNKKVRDRVLSSLQTYDQEIAALQKVYDAKMEKKSLKKHKVIQ